MRLKRARVRRTDAADFEVRHLRTFVALIDRGSMTAAAQAMRLAQSTVSESLAALERLMGVRVLVRRRGTRVPVLTAAGEALLPHARAVLAAVDQARAAVANAAPDARAKIAIIANESVSTYLLPAPIARLRRAWPKTQFTIAVATCAGVRAGVAEGSYDAGLLLESSEPARARSRRAGADGSANGLTLDRDVPLTVFAAPTHPLAGRSHVPRAALTGYAVFISDAAGDLHALLREYFAAVGLAERALEATGSVEGVKRAVLTEPHALGVLPAYAMADEIASGRVVALSVRPAPPRMRLVAVTSPARGSHPALDALLKRLRANGA
jgi:DNA-binding transcriptional LysR family regulator